ncbi:MAG: chloride channel protein [Bdellovibrionales bacterium]|nr:chloride channel protein [Bdellovibrionales bacterium]
MRLRRDDRFVSDVQLALLCAVIGALAALGAHAFRLLLNYAELALLTGLTGLDTAIASVAEETLAWQRRAMIPVATTLGGALCGLLTACFAKEAAGGGENAVIDSFHQSGGSIRYRVPFVKALASALTIGSGGAAGREGPLAQIAAGIANYVSRVARLSVPNRRILMLAGTAAGVSAMFKTPLGAAFLAVEVLYRDLEFESDALIFCIIAAAVGYAITGFYDDWTPIFRIPVGLAFQDSSDLLWYALLGLLAGAMSMVVPVIYYLVERWFEKSDLQLWMRPAVGGMLLGILGAAYPELLGSGYRWIQQAIDGSVGLHLLFVLGLGKILAFSLTIGSGGSGGVFAPVLFSGAMFGSALAVVLHGVADVPEIGAMAVVGMAAFYAGIGRAPIASLIIVTELTGGYGLIVPTMLAVSVAFMMQPLIAYISPGTFPTLYRAQVPTKVESPTHQQEYLQTALNVLEQEGVQLSGPVAIPELTKLLRRGHPIPIGSEGSFVYQLEVPQTASIVGQKIRDLAFVDKLLIAAIFRDGQMLTPRGTTELAAGDRLVTICRPEELRAIARELHVV